MADKNSRSNAEAFEIIDTCLEKLREIGGGDIPLRWSQRFVKGVRQTKKKKCNGKHLRMAAEYLVEWMRVNPILELAEGEKEISADEECVPRGTLQRIAKKYEMHHSSAQEIISKILQSHRIEAQSLAIDLSWDE